MKSFLQGMKREHVITMLLTMGLVGLATAAQAAGGPAIPGWQPMGVLGDSLSGVPAMAVGTVMIAGSAFTLCMGDIGHGAKGLALAAGATGIATNAGPVLNAIGVAGALS